MQIEDQLNRILHLSSTPKRIVSLVPSQTELLVDLGLRTSLVGVTKFCVHPISIKREATIVGGTKQVHFDKISKLKPDIIICNKEENTREMVESLENIAPTWVSDISTVEDNLEMISRLGSVFQVEETARELIDRIVSEKTKFENFIKNKPPKEVAYFIWKKPYMIAGKNTFVDALLQLNHFQNYTSDSRYPEIELSDLSGVDLVLLSSEPYPFSEKDVSEIKKILNCQVLLVDGEYFSWYGSRLGEAFTYFRTLHDN